MIKSLYIYNYLGEGVKIDLSDGNPDHGMIIQNITGIGPPKANVSLTNVYTMDGSIFNSSRIEKRNIVMDIIFNFAPTIEDTRQRTYKYFPVKKPLRMLIETDNRFIETVGYVESNNPNIFSDSESTQISLICDDPYFYSVSSKSTVFFGTAPLFEFEFSNESLTEPLIEFGRIENSFEKTIYYDGDFEVGITIYIHSTGECGDITIYNTGTREMMKIDSSKIEQITGSSIINGDDIIINTKRGEKKVTLLRGGFYINILNALDKDSDWFTLAKGDNTFAYEAEFGSEFLVFEITNQIAFEGV